MGSFGLRRFFPCRRNRHKLLPVTVRASWSTDAAAEGWHSTGSIRRLKLPTQVDVRFGHKQTLEHVRVMSALPPKADIAERECHVRFVPKADIVRPFSD
jgi:hypothetical protein